VATTPEDLIRDARRGNEASLLRIFDEHHLPLYRFAYRLTGSQPDAEDIVQDCFLALLRPDCGFDPNRGSLRTWLFGAVRNQSLKRLRKRPGGDTPGGPVLETPETETSRNQTAAAVTAAIGGLPESQREILILAHYEQLPLSEIADITQLEIAAVKSRLQRARVTLRQVLAAYAPHAEKAL
jgi:RNA polymerase sigma-70 factor (ECF subfamily)